MVLRAQGEAGACPDAEQLALFAGGKLEGEALLAVQSHARDCSECGQVLASFTRPPVLSSKEGGLAVADTAFAFGSPSSGSARTRVLVGDLIDGKYRVDRVVGAGGMGVVVAATHVQIGREVALKFMRPEACESVDAVARFVREARSIAQIQSEHVARLLDVGTLERGEPFMVMELLKGKDLAELLRDGGPLPLPDAVDFVLQAGEAIAEAHRLGIVHRDLKPANLFVTERPDGTPLLKVLDFGISKLSADSLDSEVGLTGSRAALGSPRYMSPEQLKSPRTVGPATDVWALGCILYELLTAQFAFDGETLHGIALDIATGETPSVREHRPDAPSAIDQVITSCLEKDPTKRPESIADLALLLTPLAPVRSSLSVERICRLTGRPPPPPPPVTRSASRARLVVGAGLVVVAAVAVASLAPSSAPQRTTSASTAMASAVAPSVSTAAAPPAPSAVAAEPTVVASPEVSPAPLPPASTGTAVARIAPPRPHAGATPAPRSSVLVPWDDPPAPRASPIPDPMQHALQDRK